MNYHDPQILDALTRQFVLGTMSRRARRRFGRLVDEDERIAASVHALEDELLPMAWSLTPVEPSELVWQRIARAAGFGGQHRSELQPGRRSRWPLAAASLSAALLVSVFGWWQEWQQPPEIVTETITEIVPVAPAISVLADDMGNSLWVTRIYADLQRADVAVATEPKREPANDYELWVLRDDGVPVSLGLLPQSGERELLLSANALDALGRGEALAVSLEPLGGSPADVPTGPVLYTSTLLAP